MKTVTEYKEKALEGMSKLIKQIRPQAEEENDQETLDILERLESQLENERPLKAVQTGRELRKRVNDMGYSTNID